MKCRPAARQSPTTSWEHVGRPPPRPTDDPARSRLPPRVFLVQPDRQVRGGGAPGRCGLTAAKSSLTPTAAPPPTAVFLLRQRIPTRWTARAAYAARHVARSLVAAAWPSALEVQLSYAIGLARPTQHSWCRVRTESLGRRRNLTALAKEHFDLRPGAIRKLWPRTLSPGARRPLPTGCGRPYGHFGGMI